MKKGCCLHGWKLPEVTCHDQVQTSKGPWVVGATELPSALVTYGSTQSFLQRGQDFHGRCAALIYNCPTQSLVLCKPLWAAGGGFLWPSSGKAVQGYALDQSCLSVLRSYVDKLLLVLPTTHGFEEFSQPLQRLALSDPSDGKKTENQRQKMYPHRSLFSSKKGKHKRNSNGTTHITKMSKKNKHPEDFGRSGNIKHHRFHQCPSPKRFQSIKPNEKWDHRTKPACGDLQQLVQAADAGTQQITHHVDLVTSPLITQLSYGPVIFFPKKICLSVQSDWCMLMLQNTFGSVILGLLFRFCAKLGQIIFAEEASPGVVKKDYWMV